MFSVVGFSWFRPGQPAKEIPTKHGMETRPWLSELLISFFLFSVGGFSWFRPGQPAKEIPTQHGMVNSP